MTGYARGVLILVPVLACAQSGRPLVVRPADITSSTLEVGDATFISGSLNASWVSIRPAPGESCEPSRWLYVSTGGVYGPVEFGEVGPEIQLAVPLEFESGAPASMPTIPVESPLVFPGLQLVDDETLAYSAFSGGSASWLDSGTGTLTFSLSGSELCEYDRNVGDFSVCAETTATLTMVGAVLRRTDLCFDGVAGPLFSPDGVPLCVIEDYVPFNVAPVDCEENESTSP